MTATFTYPQLLLPAEAVGVLQVLTKAHFDAYLVGGAVRDLLSNNNLSNLTDFDFTTNATPEEIKELFPESVYENNFGTVLIAQKHLREQFSLIPLQSKPKNSVKNRLIDLAKASKLHSSLISTQPTLESNEPNQDFLEPIQITTYRSDGSYEDHRRPTSVSWGKTLEEDILRRDFTINSLAIKVSAEKLGQILISQSDFLVLEPQEYEVVDYVGGLEDLQAQYLRSVGPAKDRFGEDALRMLRAIRFSVQLNFEIDTEILEAIRELSSTLNHVSQERITVELLKMLASSQPKKAIELLDKTGLLSLILPELLLTKNVQQSGHHTTDVWTHSLDSLENCPSEDPIVRLATLLHDIAKPQTQRFINNAYTFYNHEIVGARIAKQIAIRLRLSKRDQERIFILVRYHMFHYQPQNTDASVRRFMRQVGLEHIDDILDLREGDRLGSGARKTSWRLEEFKQRMIEQLNQPLDVTDLAINGHDLMNELQMQPGKKMGEVLQYLFELVMEDASLNEKEKLLKLAEERLRQN